MLILGVDYGRRRVGVATGNLETGNCTPLTVLSPKDSVSWRKLFARWQPGLCVVGLPLSMDGSMSLMGWEACAFARRLALDFDQSIVLADERLSTASVRVDLELAQGKNFAGPIDDLAAARILSAWLCDYALTKSEP